jgi:D-amino-acid oxidase
MGRVTGETLIIGAGVSGLTTAVSMAEAGLAVRVYTRDPPRLTTSAASGAIWDPHLVAHDKVPRWSRDSLAVFKTLAGDGRTGVRSAPRMEIIRTGVGPPDYLAEQSDFRMCQSEELPDGFVTGWAYTALIIDMPVYLDYLTQRLVNAGGRLDVGESMSLGEIVARASFAVNCTGSGARELVADADVTPVRGELVVVDNPGIERFLAEISESPELTYILPQGEHVVLGGSADSGRTDLTPDPKIAEGILARCIALEPRLRGARVRGHRVGLRPSRPQVRLEHEKIEGCHLIHNYGHGGAGVTLSWGCAQDVLSLIKELL